MTARVILLGTGGGPIPMRGRRPPAQAVVIGDRVYLVDCGDGTTHQLVAAGLDPGAVAGVFITHAHSDHFAGYLGLVAALYHLAALAPRPGGEPIPVWGPGPGPAPMATPWASPDRPAPSITDITADLISADATELNVRPGGRSPVETHDLRVVDAGPTVIPVTEDERVRITASAVEHPPTAPAFAYRFDTDDGSVVFSGDTAPTAALSTLARDADVLIHEAYDPDWLADLNPLAPTIFERTHSTAEQAGRAADRAGVQRLVLNHLIPADPGIVGRERWARAAAGCYSGDVVVGRDLATIPLVPRRRS